MFVLLGLAGHYLGAFTKKELAQESFRMSFKHSFNGKIDFITNGNQTAIVLDPKIIIGLIIEVTPSDFVHTV